MPSGQPILFQTASKCLQILAKIRFLCAFRTASLVSKGFKMLANISKNKFSVCPPHSQPCFKRLQNACKYSQKRLFCMPSGQPTLFQKASKCLQILTKMRFLHALWTANLVSKGFKMFANISQNEMSVCPPDNQPCFKRLQHACKY